METRSCQKTTLETKKSEQPKPIDENKDGWSVEPSEVSKNTINPIRNVVDKVA